MKKLLLLLVICLSSFIIKAQEKISFPQDFRLDAKLLPGMSLAEVNKELKSVGIHQNPGVTIQKKLMRYLTKVDSENMQKVYYEIYVGKKQDIDDAGVIVTQFSSEEAVYEILDDLEAQSNIAYLLKDNYLIQIWSDVSQNREKQISNVKKYYQEKLKAKEYKAKESFTEFSEAISAEAIEE